MTAPTQLRAGDSAAWTIELPAYAPADGWSLHYRALFQSAPAVDIASTPAVDTPTTRTVALTAAVTAPWSAGLATLVHWVQRGAAPDLQRITLGSAPLSVLPDLSVAAAHDGRSINARSLADARAALAAYLASGRGHVQAYTISGRSMTFRSITELRDLIAYFAAEVAKEQSLTAALTGSASGRIYTRM